MSAAPSADLAGWVRSTFTGATISHECLEKGTGPGVVLIPEVPGVTPEVLGFGQHLVDQGFTVVIPSLFGTPGRTVSGPYVAGVLARLCVASEFRALATNARRPIADFLRALTVDLNARTPGPGVGVIGMCFTGGFALAAAVDDSVLAPVLSQPSVPFAIGRTRGSDVGVSVEELDQVAARAQGGLCLLGLRFSEDRAAPSARFAALSAPLGNAFEVIELDSSQGNPGGFGKSAHSVLTLEVREQAGHLAMAARDRVVAFLHERLDSPGA